MGIAKTICAYGIFDFYSSDYVQFVSALGQLLKVNINTRFSDDSHMDQFGDKENEFYNNNYDQTYNLTVSYYDIDENNPIAGKLNIIYNLEIPINFPHQKELDIEFYPNGIFFIIFLPFDTQWKFFIEDLLGENDHYYKNHKEIVLNIMKIRECYVSNLRRINCKELVIWTDGHFISDDLHLYQSFDKRYSFMDLIDQIQNLDNIEFYNFMDVVNQKVKIKSNHNEFLDIALIDKF
jgi:hypothetical protein